MRLQANAMTQVMHERSAHRRFQMLINRREQIAASRAGPGALFDDRQAVEDRLPTFHLHVSRFSIDGK